LNSLQARRPRGPGTASPPRLLGRAPHSCGTGPWAAPRLKLVGPWRARRRAGPSRRNGPWIRYRAGTRGRPDHGSGHSRWPRAPPCGRRRSAERGGRRPETGKGPQGADSLGSRWPGRTGVRGGLASERRNGGRPGSPTQSEREGGVDGKYGPAETGFPARPRSE
jgi:hypothetical protein